jgi:hypothetical protein
MSKDILQIQKDHIRVLAYEKDAEWGDFKETFINIVVGAEDMTIREADFERLYDVLASVLCLLPRPLVKSLGTNNND